MKNIAQRHKHASNRWFGRMVAALVLTAAGLFAALLLAGPAGASTGNANSGQTGSSGHAATSRAVPKPRAASAVGSGAAAEITSTLVAGVLILGAAGAVLVYTARHRDSYN